MKRQVKLRSEADQIGQIPTDLVWTVTAEPSPNMDKFWFAMKADFEKSRYGYFDEFDTMEECVKEMDRMWEEVK